MLEVRLSAIGKKLQNSKWAVMLFSRLLYNFLAASIFSFFLADSSKYLSTTALTQLPSKIEVTSYKNAKQCALT